MTVQSLEASKRWAENARENKSFLSNAATKEMTQTVH